ncbi:unnamed protein product [Heterobilharzia americana]|nr:unnamed protein product [Heterobilharzia americana]
MSTIGLLSVYTIQLHLPLNICSAIASLLVRCQPARVPCCLFLLFWQSIWSSVSSWRRRQLLINVCSLLESLFMTHQVSQSYSSTDLTLVLKICTLFTLYAECSAVQCSRSPH